MKTVTKNRIAKNHVQLIVCRLYLRDNVNDLMKILETDIGNRFGLVLLCGTDPADLNGAINYDIQRNQPTLKKNRWQVYYIGQGKRGFNVPWNIVFKAVKKYPEIEYFALSDADEQLPIEWLANMTIDDGVKMVLPQRKKREFGEFTFERNVIEDIENAFVRIASDKNTIADLQPGLFILHRTLIDEFDFDTVDNYKWIGDLYLIEQILRRRIPVQLIEVDSSDNHTTSTIFDYSGPLNELLMGIPVMKMKELVDYAGINLESVKNVMLKAPEDFLPTFYKYNAHKRHGDKSLDTVRGYMDFIVGLYKKTAEIYRIKL